MNSLTKEQLVSALTEYYKQAQVEPDDFTDPADPAEDAYYATEYIFEIAAQQSNQGEQV